MGKRKVAQSIDNLSPEDYYQAMGANIDVENNSGISITNQQVYSYYSILRNYALNRYKWTSPDIPERELRLIETNLFRYGRCALVRPSITKNSLIYKSSQVRVFQCAFGNVNLRTKEPLDIILNNVDQSSTIINITYTPEDFSIIIDNFGYEFCNVPFYRIAWEFANKLYELDLAFNANSHKMRMPFLINSASISSKIGQNGSQPRINNFAFKISSLLRSAFGRNEQFVEIPEDNVGSKSFFHESAHTDNFLMDHIDAQNRIYRAYFERLGLYTNRDKIGSYTVKDLQEEGDETGDFVTRANLNNRILCAKEASKKFGITLSVEITPKG